MKLWTSQQHYFCADQWWIITAVIDFKINFETTFYVLLLCILISEIGRIKNFLFITLIFMANSSLKCLFKSFTVHCTISLTLIFSIMFFIFFHFNIWIFYLRFNFFLKKRKLFLGLKGETDIVTWAESAVL